MNNEASPGRPERTRSYDPFILALLVISLAGNVYLASRAFRAPVATAALAGPVELREGTVLGALEAEDLQGAPQRIRAEDSTLKTVVYVFTTRCPWCARNLPNVKALAANQGTGYRFIALALDDNVPPYIQANGIQFPVLIKPSAQTRKAYGLGAVPQTIVLSPKGEVLKAWRGAYVKDIATEVSDVLGVTLPGLIEIPPQTASQTTPQTAPQGARP